MDGLVEENVHEFIQRCLDGDMEAFGELYDQTIPDVKKTVLFLLDSSQDVEDVIHDIYLEVFKSLRNYNHSRTFSAWLTGLAIRQIQNYRRRNWKIVRLFKKVNMLTLPEAAPDFSQWVVKQLEQQQLMEQIQKLPFKFRSVLVLKYIHGYSQDEMAEILQLPVGTVKSRLHHALLKARAVIGQQTLTREGSGEHGF